MTLGAAVMSFFVLVGAGAHAATPLVLRGASVLWIEGDSTLHRYASTATRLELDAGIADGLGAGLAGLRVERFTLRIAVAGLESGDRRLDRNLRKAMRSERHPDIVFTLEGWDPSPLKVRGRLALAGVERPVEFAAAAEVLGEAVRVRGRKELLMSDFGIAPPTFFFGALRADDLVVVHFDVTLGLDGRLP